MKTIGIQKLERMTDTTTKSKVIKTEKVITMITIMTKEMTIEKASSK